MKHKERQLEYARQYQTMSAKKWQKAVLLDEKKFNLGGSGSFQKYWHAKDFPGENYSTKEEDSLWSGVGLLIFRKIWTTIC